MTNKVAALFEQAYDLVGKRRFAEAKPLLEECLRLLPDSSYDAPVRQELSRVLHALGDPEGALKLRMEVKRLTPDRHANLWKLAQLLAELGRFHEALIEALEAFRLDPKNPHYQETIDEIKRRLTTIRPESPSKEAASTFTTFSSQEYAFSIDIPADWHLTVNDRKSQGGILGRLRDALSDRSVFTAMSPDTKAGFARLGVEVRTVDKSSFARQQIDYAKEQSIRVAGVPAVAVKYTTAGTRFCKVAVVRGQREYIIQFGHDGVLSEQLIDTMIASFKFK